MRFHLHCLETEVIVYLGAISFVKEAVVSIAMN